MPRPAKRSLATDETAATVSSTPAASTGAASSADPVVVSPSAAKKPRTAKARGTEAAAAPDAQVAKAAKAPAEQADGEKPSRRETMSKADAHPRDLILPVSLPDDMSFLKIMTWNVNGFKALMTNKLSVFTSLIAKHQPDVVCLQETKLQANALDGLGDVLPGYDAYWHCSTEKKGYSGTAMFIRRVAFQYAKEAILPGAKSSSASASLAVATKTTTSKKQKTLSTMWGAKDADKATAAETVTFSVSESVSEDKAPPASVGAATAVIEKISLDFGEKRFSGEGRVMTLETDRFFVVGAYIPNSGEGLVRLKYRVEEWDPAFFEYLHTLSKSKPVIYTGDLNVGHLDLDIHNPTAKHIVKQAGLTPEERNSFTQLLSKKPFRDAFRHFYPNAIGQFTYWSQRTFARPVNKGIRLDYFICSDSMFCTDKNQEDEVVQGAPSSLRRETSLKDVPVPGVADCYILYEDTVGVSDHCPVMLVVRVA